MDRANFRIDYTAASGEVILSTHVEAMDDFEACDIGWAHLPEGAEDFQVTLVDS
ncbi:hypothetical protein [Devosia riboflavina]|uniref:hypothetical protein n=1 Tax=Devosia riboflavina TaxID=46914 RepID=UPI001362C1E1|nr:hypothetical protein [Devosia riboflavina]